MRSMGNVSSSVTSPILTLVTSAVFTSRTFTITGHQAGDLIVVWNGARSSTGTTPGTITVAGFTTLCNAGGSGTSQGVRAMICYQIAANSTSIAYAGINSTTEHSAYAIFRPSYPITGTAPFQGTTTSKTCSFVNFDAYSTNTPGTRTINLSGFSESGTSLALAQLFTVNTGQSNTFTRLTELGTDATDRQSALYYIYNPSDVLQDSSLTTGAGGGQWVYQGAWLGIY